LYYDARIHEYQDTHIHSEYVILIAFPLQHWLHERGSFLRYTYTACLVSFSSSSASRQSSDVIGGFYSSILFYRARMLTSRLILLLFLSLEQTGS